MFSGEIEKTVACNACGHFSVTSTDQFREIKISVSNNTRTIENGLMQSLQEERILGHLCEQCENRGNSIEQSVVTTAPAILAVLLKRFDAQNNKIMTSVAIVRGLNFANETYKLVSLIQHHGNTPHSGHYTAVTFNKNEMTTFDDQDVETTVTNVYNFKQTAFMLFYERHHGEPEPVPSRTVSTSSLQAILDAPVVQAPLPPPTSQQSAETTMSCGLKCIEVTKAEMEKLLNDPKFIPFMMHYGRVFYVLFV